MRQDRGRSVCADKENWHLFGDSEGRGQWTRPMLCVLENKTQPSYTVAGDENGAAAVRDVMAVFQNLKIGMAT